MHVRVYRVQLYTSISKAAMISPYLLYLPIINKSAMSVKIGLDKVWHRYNR